MRCIYLMTVLVFVLGCSDNSDFRAVYDVPKDYQPYVELFIAEAALRGHTIDIKNLIMKIDPSLQGATCGKCNTNALTEDIQKIITINGTLECWFSPEDKEAFFFHEMGHCILGRLHDDSVLPNGDPKSMMVSGNLAVYSTCLYPIDGDEPCNNLFKREYYLDELFDENTPVPEWGK